MRQVQSITLGEAIQALGADVPPPSFADLEQRIQLAWQACHAVGKAHGLGKVHGALDPSRIVLGEFSDCLVVDWPAERAGSSSDPVWRSPALARGATPTAQDDVYALGAMLFHILSGRPPLHRGPIADIERRRLAGEIDPPDYLERARMPAGLLAIALKALDGDPSQRYPDAEAMAEDIARHQAGLDISAARPPATERLQRFHRRKAPLIWLGAALAISVAALAWLTLGQQVEAMAAWGRPQVSEEFSAGWQERWLVLDGDFAVKDGALVSTGLQASTTLYREHLAGPTAIEYDAEITPGSPPCDLSLLWCRELDDSAVGIARLRKAIRVQIGAYDGSYTAIIDEGDRHLAYSPFRPEPGRKYRIRVEIIDDRLSLLIDGRLQCTYRDPFPLVGGYFALYGYYQGKSFSAVRIYTLGVPATLPATATGDALAQRGLFLEAAADYALVIAWHGDDAIGATARYKRGLCLFRAKRFAEAFSAWGPLEKTSMKDMIELHRCERMIAEGDRSGALPFLERLAGSSDLQLRAQVVALWSRTVGSLMESASGEGQRELLDWLALRDRSFPEDGTADRTAAAALFSIRRFQDIIDHFPMQRQFCARALIALGRPDEAAKRFPDQRQVLADALISMGDFASLNRQVPEYADPNKQALAEARYADVAPRGPVASSDQSLFWAALLQGDGPQAAERAQGQPLLLLAAQEHGLVPFSSGENAHAAERSRRQLAAGHPAEALELAPDPFIALPAREVLLVQAMAARDRDRAAALIRELAVVRRAPAPSLFESVILPAMQELDGEAGAVSAACEALLRERPMVAQQRPRHRALFLLGKIDAAGFSAQPNRQFLDADLLLLTAIRADLARDRNAAESYRAWLGMPSWQRDAWRPFGCEAFVRWRIEALAH